MLKQQNRPQNPHSISDAHLLVVLGRLKNLALLLVRLADIVCEAKKHAFLVTNERRALIDVVNDLVEPAKRGVVSDQQDAGMVLQQAIRQQFRPSFLQSASDDCPPCRSDGPRIEEVDSEAFEILRVAGRQGELFRGCCRGDQAIHR